MTFFPLNRKVKLTMNADECKCLVLDYLNKIDGIDFVGIEVRYGTNGNIADILYGKKGLVTAIEIKSSKDNFDRLASQLSSYKRTFDYTIVFIEEDEKLKKHSFDWDGIGILTQRKQQLALTKRPRRQKNDKCLKDIIYSMPASFLKKYYKLGNKYNCTQIRQYIKDLYPQDISGAYYKYLKEKLSFKYLQYIQEKGANTLIDDLILFKNNAIGEII